MKKHEEGHFGSRLEISLRMDELPAGVQNLLRSMKQAGLSFDENDPEEVQAVLMQLMMKKHEEGQKKRDALVSREDALPGRKEAMKVSNEHYVLKNPMRGPWPANFQVCVFANGCFWGSEKGIWRLPGGGVHTTAVGYAASFTPNPTYEEACGGRSGATEAVQVVFDPSLISIVDILRWFWEAHDPTQGMGQGNDRGTQYRSGLYYFDEDQKLLYEASKNAYEAALANAGKGRGKIATEIAAAADYDEVFYYAEDYHQQYLAKPMARPYCSAQPQEVSLPPFETWAPPGLEHHAPKLPEAFWKTHGPKAGCVIRSPTAPIKWP